LWIRWKFAVLTQAHLHAISLVDCVELLQVGYVATVLCVLLNVRGHLVLGRRCMCGVCRRRLRIALCVARAMSATWLIVCAWIVVLCSWCLVAVVRPSQLFTMSGKTEEADSSASDTWDPEYKKSVQEAMVTGTKFVVDKKYKIIKPIGHGAYGVVVYVQRMRCSWCCVPPHWVGGSNCVVVARAAGAENDLHTSTGAQVCVEQGDQQEGRHQENPKGVQRLDGREAYLA